MPPWRIEVREAGRFLITAGSYDRADLGVTSMAKLEAGIQEFMRRVQRTTKAWPEPETPEDHRELGETLSKVFAVPFPDTLSVADRYIHAPGRMIQLRIYRPKDRERGPAILFFHGGGFIYGSIYTHDVYALGIAESAGAQVISVNYRLAPENPYPAATEDCYFALSWVAENADRLGIDSSRIAVGGDSCGGTLTAACTLMARDKNGPNIKYQFLIVPMLDTDFDSEQLYRQHGGSIQRPRSLHVVLAHLPPRRVGYDRFLCRADAGTRSFEPAAGIHIDGRARSPMR